MNTSNKIDRLLWDFFISLAPLIAVACIFNQNDVQMRAYPVAIALSVIFFTLIQFGKRNKFALFAAVILILSTVLTMGFLVIYADHLTKTTCNEFNGVMVREGFRSGYRCFVSQSEYNEIMNHRGASYMFANIAVSNQ